MVEQNLKTQRILSRAITKLWTYVSTSGHRLLYPLRSLKKEGENRRVTTKTHSVDRSVNITGGETGFVITGENPQITFQVPGDASEGLFREVTNLRDIEENLQKSRSKSIEKALSELKSLYSEQIPQDAIDQFVEKHFNKALKRRNFPEADTARELFELADRVDDGNLSRTSTEIRVSLFRETAAAFARKNDIPNAKTWLSKAKELKPNEDYRIDEGRFLVIEGNADEALQLLRDCESFEAKGLIMDAIYKKDGFDTTYDFFQSEIKDAGRLSPLGMLSLATKAIEAGELPNAEEILTQASPSQIEQCPAILSVRAMVRVGLCCPEIKQNPLHSILPLHPRVVRFNEEPEKVELRIAALGDLEQFLKIADELDIPINQKYLEDIALWLRLSHPDERVRHSTRSLLEEELKDIKNAVRFSRFAMDYGIPMDIEAIKSYLEKQKILGGWGIEETITALIIALVAKNDESQILTLIQDNREELIKYVHARMLDELEIEALARTGQADAADALIDRKEIVYGREFAQPLRNLVREISGGDALELRRDSFAKTGGNFERRLLIDELSRQKEFSEAAAHLIELFDLAPTNQDAIAIIDCYVRSQEYANLQAFMGKENLRSLMTGNVKLQICGAWSAYYAGDVEEARQRVKSIADNSGSEDDNLQKLMVSLAVETGKWEDLHDFLSRNLSEKDKLTAEELFAAAETGRVINFPKTEELIDAAASKGIENDAPGVLWASYLSVTQLGLEEKKLEAQTWVKRAMEISGPNGPVRKVKVKDLVELMKEARKAQGNINKMVTDGDVPLEIAVHPLHTTLTEVIAGNFKRNREAKDRRFNIAIPLFAGNKSFCRLEGITRVAIDRSSIIVLALLGHLEAAFSAFDQIVIARGAMGSFLRDIGKVRFHQPSRIKSAEQLLSHFNNSNLQILQEQDLCEDETLVEDIGEELQQLIRAARRDGGVVIVSPPIHKAGSFMEEIVDPAPLVQYICGIHELLDFLVEEGKIAEDPELGAKAAAIVGNDRWEHFVPPDMTCPIFLDGLSANCLNQLNLIPFVARTFPRVVVHESTKAEAAALIEYSIYQREVEELVHGIRKTVSKNFDQGKIKLSPARNLNLEHEVEWKDDSLLNLLYDPGDVEAVVFDDRSMNKRPEYRNEDGLRVPFATSIDLLATLAERNILSGAEVNQSLRNLRDGGALYIPIDRKELVEAAMKSKVGGNDSYELRAIANYLDFVRVRNILKLPEEQIWLSAIFHEIVRAIQTVWTEADSIDAAEDAGRRLLKLLPNPFYWSSPDDKPETHGLVRRYQVVSYAVLADAQSITDPERSRAYLHWVMDEVLEPAIRKEPTLLTEMASVCREIIAKAADEMPNVLQKPSKKQIEKFVGQQYINSLPAILRESVLKDSRFADRFGFAMQSVTRLRGDDVTHGNISKYLHSVANELETPDLKNIKGENLGAAGSLLQDGSAEIRIGKNQFRFAAAALLSTSKEKRIEVSKRLLQQNTVPKSTEDQWQARIFESELSFNEYTDFLSAIENSIENVLGKIDYDIEKRRGIDFSSILPKEASTFYALIGNPGKHTTLEDFSANVLFPRRKELLQRDLSAGLSTIGPSWLHPDEKLIELLGEYEEGALKTALRDVCQTGRDPFALIFILDICRRKIPDDDDYIGIGETALNILCEPDKAKTFLDFTIALPVVTSELKKTGLLRPHPLFYQRLAAWTWAGLVARQLSNFEFDRQELFETHASHFQYESYLHGLLERRQAPYWRPDWLMGEHLRGLINRRIHAMLHSMGEENIPPDWQSHVEKLLRDDQDLRISLFLPGPLDEFDSSGSPLSDGFEELRNGLYEKGVEKDELAFISAFHAYSCIANLTTEILEKIKSKADKLRNKGKLGFDTTTIFPAVQTLCQIAGTHKDQELAGLAVDIARKTTESKNGDFASCELHFILDAASACDSLPDYFAFIRDRVERLAFGAMSKSEANQCIDILEKVCYVEPDLSIYVGRAKSALNLVARN